ncbi:hypothetical protein M7I_1030 [Glarea lozoyensis 74030]|uniref:Uncharacterized protein n=1 Tax=Glarea lozoyensis (strain ATCC 74030 / MF5533) TaxID=1104152 RepID=H0EEZ3_GLAL7|nr:hypothetical protein M7I_1030 [Glarea lozoyensis 74030]
MSYVITLGTRLEREPERLEREKEQNRQPANKDTNGEGMRCRSIPDISKSHENRDSVGDTEKRYTEESRAYA